MGLRNRMRVVPASRTVVDFFTKVYGAKATKTWPATNCWEFVKRERAQARAIQEKEESEMEMDGKGWLLDKRMKEGM